MLNFELISSVIIATTVAASRIIGLKEYEHTNQSACYE